MSSSSADELPGLLAIRAASAAKATALATATAAQQAADQALVVSITGKLTGLLTTAEAGRLATSITEAASSDPFHRNRVLAVLEGFGVAFPAGTK